MAIEELSLPIEELLLPIEELSLPIEEPSKPVEGSSMAIEQVSMAIEEVFVDRVWDANAASGAGQSIFPDEVCGLSGLFFADDAERHALWVRRFTVWPASSARWSERGGRVCASPVTEVTGYVRSPCGRQSARASARHAARGTRAAVAAEATAINYLPYG